MPRVIAAAAAAKEKLAGGTGFRGMVVLCVWPLKSSSNFLRLLSRSFLTFICQWNRRGTELPGALSWVHLFTFRRVLATELERLSATV
jgi:hypothetical protein